MKTKVIIIVLLTLLIIFNITGCNTLSDEELEVIDFIKDFYNTQYKSYSEFELCDFEPYLDMNKIQNQNKVIAYKRMIIEHQHLDEMKYCYIDRGINPITYEVNDIKVDGDYASINIDIGLTKGKYYPEFIYEGENKFVMKKIDDNWKIVNHSYEGMIYFEKSDREILPLIDEAKIKKLIDYEYGKSPFSS